MVKKQNTSGRALSSSRGFTLIEIVTVIGILVVTSAVLLVNNRLNEAQLNLSTDAAGIASAISRAKALTLQNLSDDICGYGVYFNPSDVATIKDSYVIFKDIKTAPSGEPSTSGTCDKVYTPGLNEVLSSQESQQDLGGGIRFVSSGSSFLLKDVVFYTSDAKVELTGFNDPLDKIGQVGAGLVIIQTESTLPSYKTLKITTTGQVTTKSGNYLDIEKFDTGEVAGPGDGTEPPIIIVDCINDCACAANLAIGETCLGTCGETCFSSGDGGGSGGGGGDECTPNLQTRTSTSCPAGQTGTIMETQYYTCPAGAWGDWIITDNTCTVPNLVPTITSIFPRFAMAGSPSFTLVVNGTNFISSSVVKFSGSNKPTTYISASQLTAIISASDLTTARTFDITVFNPTPGGGTSGSQVFYVVANINPVPAISSISPTSKTAGSPAFTLTVNGSNFINGSIVKLDGSNRSTTFVGSTQLTAVITATDLTVGGDKSITVLTPAPGGGTSGSKFLSVIGNNPVPAISSIFPRFAMAGSPSFTLVVNGTNFISSSVVKFAGTSKATTYVSASQLTAIIPASDLTTAGTFDITVFNPTPGGGTSNTQTLTVTAPPTPVCTAAMCTQWGTCSGSSQTCIAFNQACTGGSSVSKSCTPTSCVWTSRNFSSGTKCRFGNYSAGAGFCTSIYETCTSGVWSESVGGTRICNNYDYTPVCNTSGTVPYTPASNLCTWPSTGVKYSPGARCVSGVVGVGAGFCRSTWQTCTSSGTWSVSVGSTQSCSGYYYPSCGY